VIIGYVLFAVLWAQAIWGFAAHIFNKQQRQRTFEAYFHVWLGRSLITLGMIQGPF
jgi:predicted membrane channel-forming protein YqfA (hemolysin III family)